MSFVNKRNIFYKLSLSDLVDVLHVGLQLLATAERKAAIRQRGSFGLSWLILTVVAD